MDNSSQTGADRADTDAGGGTSPGGSDIGDRAQTDDLVSDRELGMTEPLGEDHRGSSDDLSGSTWGSAGDPGSALGNPGETTSPNQT